MEVGWVSYMLLGVTTVAFLENIFDCICLVSVIYTSIYNIFIAILTSNVRCKYGCAL